MSRNSVKIDRLNIWHVLALALVLRALLPIMGFCFTHDASIFYTPDSASYIVPARELVVHHRFLSGSVPELTRTPGYPLLLTVGLLLGRLEVATITLQILLSCLTVFMIYRTALLLFEPQRTAIIAAVLYALDPFSILFASLIAPETLFTAVVTVGIYCLVRYLKEHSLWNLLVSAGALASSVYTRPIGYYLPLIIVAGLAAWALVTRRPNKLRVLANTFGFVVVSLGLIGLWQIRNWVEIAIAVSQPLPATICISSARHLSWPPNSTCPITV